MPTGIKKKRIMIHKCEQWTWCDYCREEIKVNQMEVTVLINHKYYYGHLKCLHLIYKHCINEIQSMKDEIATMEPIIQDIFEKYKDKIVADLL